MILSSEKSNTENMLLSLFSNQVLGKKCPRKSFDITGKETNVNDTSLV